MLVSCFTIALALLPLRWYLITMTRAAERPERRKEPRVTAVHRFNSFSVSAKVVKFKVKGNLTWAGNFIAGVSLGEVPTGPAPMVG